MPKTQETIIKYFEEQIETLDNALAALDVTEYHVKKQITEISAIRNWLETELGTMTSKPSKTLFNN